MACFFLGSYLGLNNREAMLGRGEKCDKCGAYGIDRDNRLRGPLEGDYEYLCKRCALEVGLFHPLKYKQAP